MRSPTPLLCILLAAACGPATIEDEAPSADGGPAGPDGGGEVASCGYDGPRPGPISGTPGDVRWVYEHNLQVEFAPAIAPDGTVVVQGKRSIQTAEGGPTVIAVRPDGQLAWSAITDPGSVPAPPATIHCGVVLAPGTWKDPAGELNARLYQFDLASGTAHDPITLVGPAGDGVAIGVDGTVYAPATDLHAIGPDGVEWNYPMVDGGKTGSNAAVGPSGTIYVGARGQYDHNLHAVNPDGSEKWKRDTGRAIIDPIAIDDQERIYSLNAGGLLSVYEANGDLAWSYQLDSGSSGGGMVIGPDGTVYVGSIGSVPGSYTGEYLFALQDGGNGAGQLVWRKLVGLSWIGTTPALSAGGTLYVTDFCRNIVAVRASDGMVQWDYALPGLEENDQCAGFSAPAIAPNGAVYAYNEGSAAGEGGGLYAFIGDGTGPAKSAWPQEGSNPERTSLVAPLD